MPSFVARPFAIPAADPRLERGLRTLLIAGLVLVLLLPMARAHNDWLGWMPLWLVGMPAVALWSLHRFRLPAGLVSRRNRPVAPHRRKPGAQARRRYLPVAQRFPRAA